MQLNLGNFLTIQDLGLQMSPERWIRLSAMFVRKFFSLSSLESDRSEFQPTLTIILDRLRGHI